MVKRKNNSGFIHFAPLVIIAIIAAAIFLIHNSKIITKAFNTTQNIKMWVLSYTPPGGVRSVYPAAQVEDPVAFTQNTLLPAMNNASKYHGYSDPNAIPALNYILDPQDIRTENNPPPTIGPNQYDYSALFATYDLCNYAKANDIKAVIVWGAGSGTYQSGMAESAVTGTILSTNGPSLSYCPDKTIVIYGLNYERGLAEALESYGHHLESVFSNWRPEYRTWSDYDATQNTNLVGRGDSCGSNHNPPNARCEYDRSNPSGWLQCGAVDAPPSVPSDCRNWKPDGSGLKEQLDCTWWNCDKVHDGENWLMFWMQNMPGLNNGLVGADGQPIPSWWDYIADSDSLVVNGSFSSLSSELKSDRSTFNFSYSGPASHYEVDMSSSPDFTSDIYNKFANDIKSPIVETNPTKMTSYECGSTMYWRIRAVYKTQTTVTSSIQSAVVDCAIPTPTPDTTNPTISITNPLNNADVIKNSTITITADANDNIGVTKVEFYVNGSLKCTDTSSSYSCNWKVPGKPKVTYTLTATAYDANGNKASNSVKVISK